MNKEFKEAGNFLKHGDLYTEPNPPNWEKIIEYTRDEAENLTYGGPCPNLCDIDKSRGHCPHVENFPEYSDKEVKTKCEEVPGCMFLSGKAVAGKRPWDKNRCILKHQEGCVTMTEDDFLLSDKILTDSPLHCDRFNVGCIFNRGHDVPPFGRAGPPKCIRGCVGSKYWQNDKYIWGSGGTPGTPFKGSWSDDENELGPVYLEAAPSSTKPGGWGGGVYSPYNGHGKLPQDLGLVYTLSKGHYVPPCNLPEDDISAGNLDGGYDLAGPGCILTPPQPEFGFDEWRYKCTCGSYPYLTLGQDRPDGNHPCLPQEFIEDLAEDRSICSQCHIQNNPGEQLYGFCIAGKQRKDNLSTDNENKLIKNHYVYPILCPTFCKDSTDEWNTETQCFKAETNKCWVRNKAYDDTVLSLQEVYAGKVTPPFSLNPFPPDKAVCKKIENQEPNWEACYDCAQTPPTFLDKNYTNVSQCLRGGGNTLQRGESSDENWQSAVTCSPLCPNCTFGRFGEPLQPYYDPLDEASQTYGILYQPIRGATASANTEPPFLRPPAPELGIHLRRMEDE